MNKKKTIIIAASIAAALVAVLLLLIFLPKGGDTANPDSSTIDEGVSMSASTDENGVHQVTIQTDKDGKIENNSYGTLMEYYPADISQIHIENAKGAFDVVSKTPEGEATVYTIKGYEDFDLQAGNPDLIASAAAKLEFSRVATLDKAKSGEFGFDSPRAGVTVTYNDNTKSIITVGSEAPQQAGTYVKFGTGDAVYVVDTETVEPFAFGVTDLISLTINNAADNTDNNEASKITVSGANFPEAVTLVPNTNENYSASYQMTAPASRLANEKESSLVSGGIRGLFALSVKMVNPTDSQLSSLGLSNPYARLTASYPDLTVDLIASQPDSEGSVNLMVSGRSVVYAVSADKVPWVTTSYEKLCSEYALYPKLTALSNVSVTADGKTTDFELSTHESVTTDDEGVETSNTVTVVTHNGDEIQIGDFSTFYDKLAMIALADAKTDNSSGSDVLRVRYTFADGSSDSVSFVDAGGDLYVVVVNGEMAGHSHKADVSRAVSGIAEVLE